VQRHERPERTATREATAFASGNSLA